MQRVVAMLVVCGVLGGAAEAEAGTVGYYRQPAMTGDTVLFVAEGDLWKVPAAGGLARRLTTHAGDESHPAVSPDGKTVAFSGRYEGPAEVYVVPIDGGLPRRLTYDAAEPVSVAWTPGGKVLFGTRVRSTLPSVRLETLDPATGRREAVPLAEASEGAYDPDGNVLVFTRLPFQGSHTRRYKGGTAQNLWKFDGRSDEAVPLTGDYSGTSRSPLWFKGRLYFATDRDGTMNLWSVKPDGTDPKAHTKHAGFDIASPSLAVGSDSVVYQHGADLRIYEIGADRDRPLEITLDSDLDQTRERWVKTPSDYLTSSHVSHDGGRVALTARGRVFVATRGPGRLVEASRKEGVRYRDARFLPDGKAILALSDESGEVELATLPANGVGAAKTLTTDGDVLRWEAVPSPDGKRVAHRDKNQRLWVFDVATGENKKVDESPIDDFENLSWSPDGRWLAYVAAAENSFQVVRLYSTADGSITPLTTDRYGSHDPAWAADGKSIYLLSDRNLKTTVESPWGPYQPEPFLDKKTKIYQLALRKGLRPAFAPPDELHPDDDKENAKDGDKPGEKSEGSKDDAKPDESRRKNDPPEVIIDRDGLAVRLFPLPVPPGNYRDLAVNAKGLFWLSNAAGERKSTLSSLKFARKDVEVKAVASEVNSFELSGDGKTLLVRKGEKLHLVDAAPGAADLAKTEVDLGGWSLSVKPRDEWRQMFDEAWRLERDYFYDRGMHGLDWKRVREKYRPLVDRVASRAELSDLLAQMVAELSALHIFVRGGDLRAGADDVETATLGATFARDEAKGGYRVLHLYKSDPDEPERASPLSRPGVDVGEGDVIAEVDGAPALDAPDLGALLRRKAGKQVLLRVKPAAGEPREVVVKPLTDDEDADLRYHEWEYTRRKAVDDLGGGDLGYLHLRAMGGANFTEWAKGFYPVFQRKGLVIDVRHNRGGNIDSWLIGRLLRKPWFYWQPRVGRPPSWNMQFAFRGHVVVLCDQFTASDGEAFAEGVKRLGIGTVIGTRTWGGEIWLSSSNVLVDKGIATAAEIGVYGPEGSWLIEGHGVEPNVVVDNLPHATFLGRDAQLEAAVELLKTKIKEHPVDPPTPPPYPDKSFKEKDAAGNGD